MKEKGMLRFLLSRYDRWSLVALVLMLALYVTIPFVWNDLARQNLQVVNWFLIAIWIFMSALLCWDVRPAQDMALAAVALAGGAMFEGWGTNTGLWWYFTGEKPPLWILPAWPVAALATARIVFAFDRVLIRWKLPWRALYWFFAVVFALGMARFIRPSLMMWPTWLMSGALVVVIVTGHSPRRDVSLLLAGMALGYFLEYWGTSRVCWTYYTREIPPLITVMAHGYGQVAFARILDAMDWGVKWLGVSWTVRARDASDLAKE